MSFRGMNCAALLALGLLLSACGGGGGGGSDTASTTPVANTAPVANAGTAQTVVAGATITLDGSASSDANGDTLTYQWSLISVPTGSTAALSSATAQKPTFVAGAAGSYIVSLVVNDGKVNSPAVTVTISAFPSAGYTKLDAAGLPLTDSATSWSCVRDNAKKLVWEVKNMTDPAHLRYHSNGYTNYDSTTSAQYWNGPTSSFLYPTQAQIDASTNSIGFKKAVNAQGLCGAMDWRLPDIDELIGLQTGSSAPYINASYFPEVNLTTTCATACYGYVWSSSPYPGYADAAKSIYYPRYGADYGSRHNYYVVRLVRSGQ